MANWKLVEGAAGLRMESSQLRAVVEEDFTWAHLLYGKLGAVQVGIFYFPSRLTPQQTDPATQTFHVSPVGGLECSGMPLIRLSGLDL